MKQKSSGGSPEGTVAAGDARGRPIPQLRAQERECVCVHACGCVCVCVPGRLGLRNKGPEASPTCK